MNDYYEILSNGVLSLVVVNPDGSEIHRRDFDTYKEYQLAIATAPVRF